MVRPYFLLCAVFVLPLLTRSALAQSTPDVFGTAEEGITIVGFQDFFPGSAGAYTQSTAGERQSSSPMYAGLNMLPNGALITQVGFYVRDDDSSSDFNGNLCHTFVESNTGSSLQFDCEAAITTMGVPGETLVFANYDPPLPILYRYDADGDGDSDVVNYFLQWYASNADDVAIRACRIRWKRQVSPAPATATFNDVPTSHPFFPFVEALAASGISAGCGTDIYCPNAPLTRGQMAVFLAKALGLHWPWNATP
jgi:S-layer homology domain